MQNHLRRKLEYEKAKLDVLRAQEPNIEQVSLQGSESEDELDREQLRELCDELVRENERLEKENEKIIENINEERQRLVEANIAYRVKNEILNQAWWKNTLHEQLFLSNVHSYLHLLSINSLFKSVCNKVAFR